MKFFKKFIFAIHAFFWGLRSADKKMLGQVNNGGPSDSADEDVIDQAGSVWSDLLQKQETERVAEFRDEQYRVYRESEKYKIDKSQLRFDSNGDYDMSTIRVEKQNMLNLTPEGILLNEGDKLILEQLNFKTSVASYNESVSDDNPPINTIKIERDYFPRFKVENYAKKIILKNNPTLDEGLIYFDLYCSKYHTPLVVKGQGLNAFIDESDVFFLRELKQLMNKEIKRSDITEFDSIEFTTHKAYNAEELLYYKIVECKFVSVTEYDGDYVISFVGYPVCNGNDLIAKYRTEAVDKKFATKEQRSKDFEMSEFTTNMVYGASEEEN